MNRLALFDILLHKKVLLYLLGAAILLLATGFVFYTDQQEQRRGKLAVEVATVPRQATVVIGQQQTKTGKIYLTEGEYAVMVQSDGFHTYNTTLRVNKYAPQSLYVALQPESEQAKKWAVRHQNAYADLERRAGKTASAYGKSFQERWPITKSLPIKDPYFTISYRHHPDETISLTVRGTSPQYRMLALRHLRKQGFEPTEYRIEFIDFQNPLSQQGGSQ